jgi:hypothetical protein
VTAIVLCDRTTVDNGPHTNSVHEYADGTPIAFHTLQQVLDDPATTIVEADVNEHGVVQSLGDAVLDHGRNRRFATADQKLALRAMHRSCLFPGCDIPFDRCEQHHLIEYQHHGTTNLIDLGPVCVRHHHQLHAHNWKLRLDRHTRALTITYPDGTTRTHPLTRLTPPNNNPPAHPPPTDEPAPPANSNAPPPTNDQQPTAPGDAA